ncbi:MAG TPA: hypothetical protein DCO86_05465 [Spirochaetaceae bacterium]|nr:hypothetical protein [Spirochaetaceae bacterium]
MVLTFLIYWMMSIRSNDFFYDSRSLIFLPSCLILFLTENKSVSLALMVLNLTLLVVFPFITLAVIAKSFAITSLVIILYSNGTRMPAVSDGSDFNMIGMTTEKAVESEAGQSDRENGTVKEGEGVFQHFKRFRFGDKWQRGRSAGRNGLAGVLLDGLRIDEYERRSTRRYYAKAFVALCVYMCFVALIDFSFYASKRMLAMDLIFEVAKLAAAFLFAFFVTRIFVDVFAMPTKDNLVRLLYENSALLESFKAKCKGSFEHCMEVMDIAMLAADAIGCNSLLVGAAARYHDVGKMNHPEYFTENNPNESAHKYFSSKISAGLIKRHVKDGIDMIKASGLRMPLEALKIIEEHHGNDHISFFLLEAEREKGGTTKEKDFGFVDEDIFSYDLDRPSTKESAILMLADISEAGCRSLTEHTDEKHREFIHGLLMAKFDERQRTGRFKDQKGGQLENSTLTIGEFRIVEEAIVNKINAMYNTKRVSYKNTEKEQKKEQRINAN